MQARVSDVSEQSVDARVTIGHVQLKVADLERAIASITGYSASTSCNAWAAGPPSCPRVGTTTLGRIPGKAGVAGCRRRGPAGFHLASRYLHRAALGDAYRRLVEAGVPLDGASDHVISEVGGQRPGDFLSQRQQPNGGGRGPAR